MRGRVCCNSPTAKRCCRYARGAGSLYAGGPDRGEARMNFLFVCGWCDEENVVFCPRTGFWGNRFEDPEDFDCWSCGGTSTTPYSPWTPAD